MYDEEAEENYQAQMDYEAEQEHLEYESAKAQVDMEVERQKDMMDMNEKLKQEYKGKNPLFKIFGKDASEIWQKFVDGKSFTWILDSVEGRTVLKVYETLSKTQGGANDN